VNQPWLDFTGRDPRHELGLGWLDHLHPADREQFWAGFRAALSAHGDFRQDFRLRRRDGAWRWLLATGRPWRISGQYAGHLGSCIDITEMKEALEDRRHGLQEREALLAELHHRVKNNAQATSSFLGLQASRATDPVVATALRGAAARVLLAALVQDRMFRVGNDELVELGEELAATGRAALDLMARSGIRLHIQLDDKIYVPVWRAAALALMVNELVTNAVKHAFPRRGGTISLQLRRDQDDWAELRISDDGIGLPSRPPLAGAQNGLGLDLARRLARQAKAELRLDTGYGTTAVTRFKAG